MNRSLGRRFGLIAVALALAWLMVRGYADYLARPAPDRALSLNRNQPIALVGQADRALAQREIDAAEAAAGRVLAQHPFEGRALRVLGAVAERHGDRDRAMSLMRLAVATTPRESAAQFWLAINALADQDLDGALRRLDRLLRVEPELLSEVFPVLSTVAVNPIGSGPVATYLAAGAPWRAEFMRRLIGSADSSADISRLMRAIRMAGGNVSEVENDQLAARLLAKRDWSRLRRLLATMAPGTPESLLRDGGFDGVGRGPLLGWEIGRLPGADVLMSATSEGQRTLQLIFYDRRVPFRHVSQVSLLPPGRYRLSGRVRLDDLRTALGLAWNLSCIGSSATLGASEPMLGSAGWRDFSFDFEVPEANCGGQLLQLVLRARIAAEQQIAGKVWFDEFVIQPLKPNTVPASASFTGSGEET